MAFDWSQLITPAAITATGSGLAKLLTFRRSMPLDE
jgi:hypothetical protein